MELTFSSTAEVVFGIFGLLSLFISAGVFTRAASAKATNAELREANTDLRERNVDLLNRLGDMTKDLADIRDKLSSEIAKRELLQDLATGRKDIQELIALLQARTKFFIDIEDKLDKILRGIADLTRANTPE